jgi:Acetyltransferase (GNAT) family
VASAVQSADGEYSYVACMAVRPEGRRQGVASALLDAAERVAGGTDGQRVQPLLCALTFGLAILTAQHDIFGEPYFDATLGILSLVLMPWRATAVRQMAAREARVVMVVLVDFWNVCVCALLS